MATELSHLLLMKTRRNYAAVCNALERAGISSHNGEGVQGATREGKSPTYLKINRLGVLLERHCHDNQHFRFRPTQLFQQPQTRLQPLQPGLQLPKPACSFTGAPTARKAFDPVADPDTGSRPLDAAHGSLCFA
ncbi:Hypothetical predicted protein [Pelobates cultripes]|uniref:Uncharacterized protein n=1 Tax=Pelobates cultripes TaxID=61616 RepID=A0AAD1W9M7_PELCU|nr:Hypothetical predicted protein [Pelobates cultripes]